MAVSLTEQIANVLRGFGKHLNRRVSEIVMILVSHKNAGSIGTLAGIAIAIAFTWKFLRSANGPPQRSQRKRIASASGSSGGTQANEVASRSETHQPIQNLEDINLNFGQIVKKKLNGSRKMTCQLLGVILEETSPEELQKHASVRPSVVEVLLEIAKSCDLYLMERILDDESGERVLSALEDSGLFKTGGLVRDKVLFCSTDNGRTSFVRQLEPDWHVDTNLDITSQLSRFIRLLLHISPIGSSRLASNVFSSASLEQHFSC